MEWLVVLHLVTEAPNFTHSQSHYMSGFSSEKLCNDTATSLRNELGKPTDGGAKVTVRVVCSKKKEK